MKAFRESDTVRDFVAALAEQGSRASNPFTFEFTIGGRRIVIEIRMVSVDGRPVDAYEEA